VIDENASCWRVLLHRFENLSISRDGLNDRHLLLSKARRLPALVGMLGVAGRAASQPDFVTDHRDNRVVRETTLARAIIVENVTKP
jgi:hypothetical protein